VKFARNSKWSVSFWKVSGQHAMLSHAKDYSPIACFVYVVEHQAAWRRSRAATLCLSWEDLLLTHK